MLDQQSYSALKRIYLKINIKYTKKFSYSAAKIIILYISLWDKFLSFFETNPKNLRDGPFWSHSNFRLDAQTSSCHEMVKLCRCISMQRSLRHWYARSNARPIRKLGRCTRAAIWNPNHRRCIKIVGNHKEANIFISYIFISPRSPFAFPPHPFSFFFFFPYFFWRFRSPDWDRKRSKREWHHDYVRAHDVHQC